MLTAVHQARLLHRPQQDRVVTGWLRSAGYSVNGGVQWAYAAMLLVAIAAALVDAIELGLTDPMTYSILAAGVMVMAVFEITGTHHGAGPGNSWRRALRRSATGCRTARPTVLRAR